MGNKTIKNGLGPGDILILLSPQCVQGRALLEDMGRRPKKLFLTRIELPKLILRLTFLNRFMQRMALMNTSLTSVGGLFGYLFHLLP